MLSYQKVSIFKWQYRAGAGAGAGAGAKIMEKVEPEQEPKINNFGSATMVFPVVFLRM